MSQKRNEIDQNDQWNLEAIYSSDEKWSADYEAAKKNSLKINQYQNRLNQSARMVKDCLDCLIEMERKISILYLYAHTRHDQDLKNTRYIEYYNKAYNLAMQFEEIISWVNPEILAIDDLIMQQYLNDQLLKPYAFYLQKILRLKKYTLNEKEEKIVNMAAQVMSTSSHSFRAFNDADLKFQAIIDENQQKHELTHARFYLYLIDKNRTLREKAFKNYHNKYDEYATTLASLLYGHIKSHVFHSRVKGFASTLDAALYPNNIDPSVYLNLIQTVRQRIKSLHNYLDYKREKMQLDQLHLYDVYAPFIEYDEIKLDFKAAKNLLFECIKPLGDEYYQILKNGLEKERWIDVYETENKRSGAYSTGCYDSYPYILLNFNGTLNAARTLVHEAGHSMHTYFSNHNQSPLYAQYPIFLAEVASTFNEELCNYYLIRQNNDPLKKAYLINSRLNEIRATLFRQTMFAEFELKIHQWVENDTPLTPQLLKEEYQKLNQFYFGPAVHVDTEIAIEWARIPHFYMNYYVYQYATGISAAISLYKKVMNGNDQDKNEYLNFLKSGGSQFPLQTLKKAGVDMQSQQPVNDALDYFDQLLEELKQLY